MAITNQERGGKGDSLQDVNVQLVLMDRHWGAVFSCTLGKAERSLVNELLDEHLAIRPQYHWTDQKIQVHTFCCLLALLLGRVIERQARQLHYYQWLSSLLDVLGTIRLAMVLRPAGKKGGRPRCEWILEETESEARRVFEHLEPPQASFVYT